MEVSKFNEKLNRIDGNIYTIEEVVTPLEGIYEAELIHDNVELKTINVYTGPKLTGNKINTISFSTPSLTPWKTVIKIFSTEPQLYISYETTGDQAEAEDINNLQNAVNKTQESLNNEVNRATNAEKVLTDNLATEVTRAKNSEKTISDNVANEITRAKASEKVLTDNLNTEINRAKGSEKTISDNLSSEVNRAKVKENSIESNFNNYKTSNDSEIQGLKAKDIDLDNKKANLDYVNLELNKRYTKDQTFTREEVLKKIQDLIGTAPDTLDTFKEIADALGNDPNFATTIMNELSSKVDKVTGKSLSTNDYDNTEKSKLSDVNAKKHEHSNKSIIDKITQGLLDAWNSAYNHINDSIRHITSSERNLWNTVSDKANKTDIPSKLSQLTNDKKFITQDDIDTSQNHIHNNKSVLDKISQKTLDDINLSVDKVLKNKLTPIETDSTLTKLDNCIGEYVHNMQIKGKTLQNLWNGGNVNYLSSENRLIETTTLDLYKTNTNYTIINYNNKKIKLGIFTKANTYSRSIEVLPNSKFIIRLNDEIIKDKVGEEVNGWANSDNDKNELKKSIVILEGEVKEIPPYFEGIQSTGEIEGNKISILTCGKNLAPVNSGEFLVDKSNTSNWYFINGSGGAYGDMSNNKTKFYLPSGTYYFYGETNNFMQLVEEKEKQVINNGTHANLSEGYYIIRLRNNNGVDKITFKNIQIEEGTTATTYEPYKEDKTEILTGAEPLRGLPSGVTDVVDYDKNERIKNVGKVVFDGSEAISYVTASTSVDTLLFSINNTFGIKGNEGEYSIVALSDKFYYKYNYFSDNNFESFFISKSGGIYIRILKSKLETQDVAGFKKWLQTNPTTVYYQLATQVVEKLNIKDTLQSFENGYIQLDNSITPTAQLEYSTNLPSALSGVVEIQDKILDRVNILEKKKSLTWDELEGV
ncbi:hypothetical protein FDB40_16700 [Clostridium botulinum]|nr:hypothetical protein [Clostridium botulinum]